MDIKDFTPTNREASHLASIDELIEAGLSRPKAEKLVGIFEEFIFAKFSKLLEELKTSSLDCYERSFIQGAVVGYIFQWAEERLALFAVAQTIALAAMASQEASDD